MKDALVNLLTAAALASIAWLTLPYLDSAASLPVLDGKFHNEDFLAKSCMAILAASFVGMMAMPSKERRIRKMLKKYPGEVLRVYDLVWNVNTFCQGWLITGMTGAGKTQFLVAMMHSLMRNLKGNKDLHGKWIKRPFGSMSIDEKGDFQHVMRSVMAAHGKLGDLVVLQTRPTGANADWEPPYRCNLLGDDSIPSNTYADVIVKGAKAAQEGSKSGEKAFFINMARFSIGQGIELIRRIRAAQIDAGVDEEELVYPTPTRVYHILTSRQDYDQLLLDTGVYKLVEDNLSSTGNSLIRDTRHLNDSSVDDVLHEFEVRYWSKRGDEFSGIKSTIETYMKPFSIPEVAEVFGTPGEFSLDILNEGKHVCVAMPQSLAVERRYIQSVLKSLFYLNARRRFDMPSEARASLPLIVLFQDEGQRFMQEEDGNVDILRSAECTTVILTQDQTSLYQPLGGKPNAMPIINNLRNRVIFASASEECATDSANFVGKRKEARGSITKNRHGAKTSTSQRQEEVHLMTPAELRSLPPFHMAVCHSKGIRRLLYFQPVDAKTGKPTKWWRKEAPWRAILASMLFMDVSFMSVKKHRPSGNLGA